VKALRGGELCEEPSRFGQAEEGGTMPLYLVERHVPGMTMPEFAALRRAEERACAMSAAQGKPIRYVRSTFAPGESRCQCLFEAPNAAVVQEVNDRAQIPYDRIILVVDVQECNADGGGMR
jgi:hypothetical protein